MILAETPPAVKGLKYSPQTGIMYRTSHQGYAPVLTKHKRGGYRVISLGNISYQQHRVAWLLTHGTWPKMIDHDNGVRHDNRLSNLKDTTARGNQHNRKEHRAGKLVGSRKQGKYWTTNLVLTDGTKFDLGSVPTERMASERYYLAVENKVKLELMSAMGATNAEIREWLDDKQDYKPLKTRRNRTPVTEEEKRQRAKIKKHGYDVNGRKQ